MEAQPPIPFVLVDGYAVVFSADHALRLRQRGVVGRLIGSAPAVKRQRAGQVAAAGGRGGAPVLMQPSELRKGARGNNALLGNALPLRLSPEELAFAQREGLVEAGAGAAEGAAPVAAARTTSEERMALGADLRRRAYVPTPGEQFGCDFAAYPGDPLQTHATVAVALWRGAGDAEAAGLRTTGRDLVRMARVAQAAKKLLVLSTPAPVPAPEEPLQPLLEHTGVAWLRL